MVQTPLRQALKGARDSIPLLIAAAPFGMVFGALAISAGLSPAATLAMSLLVFAGSAQFIAVSLIAASAAFPVILMTVFVVNLRHMLYATSLMPQVDKLGQRWRIPLAFWLTDETYAVVCNQLNRQPNTQQVRYYYLGSALAMYGLWQVNTLLGILVGQQIPDITNWGLDVAMVVAFIGIVVPSLRNSAQWACALTAAMAMLLTHDWPHQTGLLFSSLVAIGVAMLVRYYRPPVGENELLVEEVNG